jgi:hypothetical protein
MAKIIIPLLHIQNSKSERAVEADQVTNVTETMSRESRTVLTLNKDINRNQTAIYQMKGTMSQQVALTVMNMLMGLEYHVPFVNVTDEFYVTHTLKRFDLFDYDGEYVYIMNETLVKFLLTTPGQDVNNIRLAVVVETLFSVHPFWLEGPILTENEHISKILINPISIMPIQEKSYIEGIHAFHPIRIMPTTMRFNLKMNEGQFDYSFGASIWPTENKKDLF